MESIAPPLRNLNDIARLIEAHAGLHALLSSVADLDLPDCWIGAGLIRNAVWDLLHGRDITLSLCEDVDVIFFDPTDMARERDSALEARLRQGEPGTLWSVKNQARMHGRNGDTPYRDTFDAISHWPETATAVAARLVAGRVEMIAPYGVDDLLDLVVRPTPAFRHKMDVYRERLTAKDWATRWPKLRFA